MYYQNILSGYCKKRLGFFQWQRQSSLASKILMSSGLACLTGVLAQIKFYLPWTPVPIVASQLGVILAAVLLGRKWGTISMSIYALGGAAGIPWFAGMTGGAAALAGPTCGYILGFILAAFFMGSLFDNRTQTRRAVPLTGIILFAQLVLVYLPGLIYLALWLKFQAGQTLSLTALLWMGYIPFILGDILKSFAGSAVAKILLPMEDY